MTDPITTTASGAFRPILSDDAIASLRRKMLLWVAAGKPDYIPTEEDAEA